jgi:D-glycero-D-manno-heptose 1,7-bisphosphate phosphatase
MSLWLPEERREAGVGNEGRDGRALFVDRDGVIIADADYPGNPAAVRLLPGSAAALARARSAGYLLIGVSNQSGIGRGYYGEADFAAVQRRVDAELAVAGGGLDALYYCPHAPEENCLCRKPRPGLLDEAATRFSWRVDRTWLVGDKLSDAELARTAGLRAALVLTGKGEARVCDLPPGDPVLVVADLAEAVSCLLSGEKT